MKIHKKILTHYLSCTSPVDKEGYLYKMKMRTATYHRRWFVLKGNVLFYQQRPADRHLLGVIVLEGCAVRRRGDDEDPHGPLCFSMVFQAPGLRAYRFAAEDRLARESWVKALLSASHCYLSLLVRDLGHQYQAPPVQPPAPPVPAAAAAGAAESMLAPDHRGSHTPGQRREELQRRSPHGDDDDDDDDDARRTLVSRQTRRNKNKSPKLWLRRNAHVTPLNGPAPLYGEWPPVGLDPLEEFSKLHEYYGEEVLQAREAWLRRRQVQEEEEHEHRCDDDDDDDDDDDNDDDDEVLIDF
ncbi:hypothetical protein CRUP_008499 [Coryphaenoides rupestris]|nr:hypothetical protein CRUP_008499 [Coryphaenoides rupestris]